MTNPSRAAENHGRPAVETTSASLADSTAPLITLRKVVFPESGLQEFTIRGRRRVFVSIRCHPLSTARAGAVLQALTRIHSLLIEPNQLGVSKDVFALAANHAAFLGTTSRHVTVAYTSKERDHPFVILNDRSDFWSSPRELSVTLLHELSHLLDAMVGHTPHDADRSPTAKSEAIHDILCYAALGFGIPAEHWAFEKYPELLRKRRQGTPFHGTTPDDTSVDSVRKRRG